MSKGRLWEEALDLIESSLRKRTDGARRSEIADGLKGIPQRTLQYRLKNLEEQGRVIREGKGPATRYRLPGATRDQKATAARQASSAEEKQEKAQVPFSAESRKIRDYLQRPLGSRKAVGYNRQFLYSYRPNRSFYLSREERAHLAEVGKIPNGIDAAGTYAKQLLNRLLLDLSWNSSRLEGNTYSPSDTRRLIELGEQAQGRSRLEAQMILNHKDAIAFLVSVADEIGFNRFTILNLHGILAQDLLRDESSAGRLRRIAVGIERSVFRPAEAPQLIEKCFNQILATANAIQDPFEQSFFAMVHLPYLQPFENVNKRVSRLAANIPFIKGNLSPLSFTGVPRSSYTDAILGVYERSKVNLLKDVFIWAYERSAEHYAAGRQSLGAHDPFRQQYREALRQLLGDVVRGKMERKTAGTYIEEWVKANVTANDRDKFREMAESDLLGLHEGNFARLQVRPSEFSAWQVAWEN